MQSPLTASGLRSAAFALPERHLEVLEVVVVNFDFLLLSLLLEHVDNLGDDSVGLEVVSADAELALHHLP